MATPRRRLDTELVRRGLVVSRTEAHEAVTAGLVTVDGAPAGKAATQVAAHETLALAAPPRRFVSRGGEKLAHALATFDIEASGLRCLDAGISTGGFTDCLLQAGAASVVAYDVGYGQVHDRLRRDARVEIHERTNVRELVRADIPPPLPGLLVADLSFIALRTVLPALRPLVDDAASAIVLVKPQFEAGREQVERGGVVRDPEVWARCLNEVAAAAASLDWPRFEAGASPLLGPAGNVEFLVGLAPNGGAAGDRRTAPVAIAAAVDEGRSRRATHGEAVRRAGSRRSGRGHA